MTEHRMPDAVLWDLDGTIVDTEPLWMAAEKDLAGRHGATWTHEDALALVGNDLMESGRQIVRRMGLDIAPEDIVVELVAVMAERMQGELEWRPGARELLADLKANGVPLALVTMSYRDIVTPLLPRLPEHTFDVVIVGDEVSDGKPHPEPYLAAARALDVDPTGCIAIEDSPTGFRSAQAAGCHVVAVPHHVPVDVSDGHHRLETLEGLFAAELASMWRSR